MRASVLCLLLAAACTSPPIASEQGQDFSPLARIVEHWVHQGRIVGGEVLVVDHGRAVLHEAYGSADRERGQALERGAIFRVRSMTKPFTGTAALLLVERGQLALSDRAAAHLPSWDNDRSGAISVEQLLMHTSGFVQGGTPQPAGSYADLRAVVDACGRAGPQHEPGTALHYSDVNSMALGALVAQLSGQSLEQFITRELIQPLGLSDTHCGLPAATAEHARIAATYERSAANEWQRYWCPADGAPFPYFRASGGLLTTTADYATWLRRWAEAQDNGLRDDNGRLLLTAPLVRSATRTHATDADGDYGYHWEVFEQQPHVFGHGGSDGTLAMVVPSRGLALLYFTQSRGTETLREWRQLAMRMLRTDGSPQH